MQLGETYLSQAEALLDEGKPDKAAQHINVLRVRSFADYPAKGKVSATAITLDFILDERAGESIGEENRRMILMRTKTPVESATHLNAGDARHPTTGSTRATGWRFF